MVHTVQGVHYDRHGASPETKAMGWSTRTPGLETVERLDKLKTIYTKFNVT
jgi:hypothetical protein